MMLWPWFIATIVSFFIFVIAVNIIPRLKVFKPNSENWLQIGVLQLTFFNMFAFTLTIFLLRLILGGE